MKVVVQRSKQASVTVEGEIIGEISSGFVLLVGITHEDTVKDVQYLADKVTHMRLFEDGERKMTNSLLDVEGEILSISQFTLYGDCRKGRRPNFMRAAKPEQAEVLYEQFNAALREKGIKVATGVFGAMMDVHLINDGPVTIIIDSKG